VRVPEGSYTGRVEGPLGRTSCLLVSTGEKTPWRLSMRAPSFASAQAMGPALVGTPMPALADAVMSFFLAVGDIDR
jgi:NADH-quinone oxidoreductase subunit D